MLLKFFRVSVFSNQKQPKPRGQELKRRQFLTIALAFYMKKFRTPLTVDKTEVFRKKRAGIYVRSVFKKYTLFFFLLSHRIVACNKYKTIKKIGTYWTFQTQQPTCGFRNFTDGMTAKPTGSKMFTCELNHVKRCKTFFLLNRCQKLNC